MANATQDGVGTTLTIGSSALEYVTLKGLGWDMGDALDASHLGNVAVKTKLPQTLAEITDLTGTAHYTISDWDSLKAERGKNQSMVLTVPGIGAITFWGYLSTMDPDEGEIGTTWNLGFTVVVTNLNASEEETVPVYAAAT